MRGQRNTFKRIADGLWRSGPLDEVEASPNRLRWNPLPLPSKPTDFLDGLVTIAGSGDAASQAGIAVHVYCANRSMKDRFFYCADGELIIVPQERRARDRHRVWAPRSRAGRNRGDAARHEVPRRGP